MTQQAASILNRIESAPEVPQGAGLRIASGPDAGTLTFRLAAAPQEGDEVIDHDGALVFLDNEAAVALADKTLDARQDADGRLELAVLDGQG